MSEEEVNDLVSKVGAFDAARLLALGAALRATRALLNLTQTELASACNISKRTVVKLEAGSHTFDYVTLASVRHGMAALGAVVEFRSGRLCVSLKAAVVDDGLGRLASRLPDAQLFGGLDMWPY